MQITEQKWRFSERVNHIPKSFIREILKVTSQPEVISFAGGLPNPTCFPVDAIREASLKVLRDDPQNALQYSISQGYLPLREYLSDYYLQKGLSVNPDEILITNGSQQALDLLGKIFIDQGDKVLMERPSYLGAIQAFSAYKPSFIGVDIQADGVNLEEFEHTIKQNDIKLFYSVPTFQNPSGVAYSKEKRLKVAQILNESNTILIEDNPYEEIYFSSENYTPIKKHVGDRGILLGTFSKMVSPGLRIGWVVAQKEVISKLLLTKEAADLHTNQLSQRIVHQFLLDNDLQSHLKFVREVYKKQKDCMITNIKKHFPENVKINNPQGGMFLWIKLPDGFNSRDVLLKSQAEKVVFVPGDIFYVDKIEENSMRLNFSNSSEEEIEVGIARLGKIIKTSSLL